MSSMNKQCASPRIHSWSRSLRKSRCFGRGRPCSGHHVHMSSKIAGGSLAGVIARPSLRRRGLVASFVASNVVDWGGCGYHCGSRVNGKCW